MRVLSSIVTHELHFKASIVQFGKISPKKTHCSETDFKWEECI